MLCLQHVILLYYLQHPLCSHHLPVAKETLQLQHQHHHKGSTDKYPVFAIEVPRKIHQPKVINEFQSSASYPDVDEGHFLHKSFGKAIFCPRNWDRTPRQGIIKYLQDKHEENLKSLNIGLTTTSSIRAKIVQLVKAYWDVFPPEGIKRVVLGY